jgi:hypothetical protein
MDDFWAIAIAAGLPLGGFVLGVAWWLLQVRRARPIVQRDFERQGYRVISMRPRFFARYRAGPFPRIGGYTRVVFRLLLRDRHGQQLEMWARWGGTGFRVQPQSIERRATKL